MGSYYALQSIFFFDRISSLLCLMAAMFTVTWIQRHNEMTALMAAGIPRLRIVAPVILAAMVITVLAAINRELVIPHFRQQISQRPSDLQNTATLDNVSYRDSQTDVLIRGQVAFLNQQRIAKPDFLLPSELGNYGKHLKADNAFYRPPTGSQPGGYLMDGMHDPKNLAKQASLRLGDGPVLITPRDAPDWLKPNQCFVVSGVSFEELVGGQSLLVLASTWQMIKSLRNNSLNYGASVRVAIHARIVQPFLDITLLFLGLPLVVSRSSRNVFLAIGLCMGVVAVFMLVNMGCQQLGAQSFQFLPPWRAAWLPLFIFIPLAVALAEPMLEGRRLWESKSEKRKKEVEKRKEDGVGVRLDQAHGLRTVGQAKGSWWRGLLVKQKGPPVCARRGSVL